MLVDINLLPKKERKDYTLWIILAVLASIFLLGMSFSVYYGSSLKKEAKLLSQKIIQVNDKLGIEQNQLTAVQENNSVKELKSAVLWAETYPIKAVPVLKHLTSLLPERGFILQYNYSEKGTVHLTVQFDTSMEAAQFLQWLSDSEWIEEATIKRLGLSDSSSLDSALINNPNNSKYVPRYIGEFDITLEKEKVNELFKKEEEGISK